MKAGTIDPSIGTKLAFVLAQLGRLREVADLEDRIAVLEQAAAVLGSHVTH